MLKKITSRGAREIGTGAAIALSTIIAASAAESPPRPGGPGSAALYAGLILFGEAARTVPGRRIGAAASTQRMGG